MRWTAALAAALIAAPQAAAANPCAAAGGTLLVGNKGENSLSFIDLATGRELRRVETGANPHEIALSPDGRRAAVVSYGGNSIDLFDIASRARSGRIDLGANQAPHGLVWLADGRMLATTEKSRTLSVVSPSGEVRAIPTDQEGSHMVAATADGKRAFVANMRSGTVSVIDLARGTKLRDLAAGTEPEGMALSPDGRRLWVADRSGDRVRVFDTTSFRELASLPTGKTPIRVLVSPDGATAITSNYGAGTLSLFDATALKPLRTVTLSDQPAFGQVTMLFGRDPRCLYVAETGIDRIAEVDLRTGTVLGRLPAGKNGDGLAIAP